MKARTPPPSLLRGVLIALVLSLIGGATFAGLSHLTDPASALRLVIAMLAGSYVFWLISRSDARIGRLTSIVGWTAAAAALGFSSVALPLYLLVHVALIWLIRSLYFHSSVLPALLDLVLSAFSIAAAVWAAEQSNSVFLAAWCFFLAQSFFVVIPRTLKDRSTESSDEVDQPFQRAQRTAEAALRRISANS
jgi:hypothetical protein